jgi:hypothetical protein
MLRLLSSSLLGIALYLCLATSVNAESTKFDFTNAVELKLISATGSARDRFGGSVSLSGTFALVGSSDSSPRNQESGSAYIFSNISTNSSNTPLEVYPALFVPKESFGGSTALWGTTAVIGAPKYDMFTGAVYVYSYVGSTWSEQQVLQAGDGSRGDYFGISVAVSEHFLIIGANQRNEMKGAVYIFAKMNTGFEQKVVLEPEDTHEYQKFGQTVAIADSFLAIGAVGDNSKSQYSHGAVYVYERVEWVSPNGMTQHNWTRLSKLYANTPRDLSNFGIAVAITRHVSSLTNPFLYTLVVGADNDEASGIVGAGSVYIYLVKPGSITFASKVVAADPKQDAQFGYSISINSGHFLIGAPGYGSLESGPEIGAAYLFETIYSANKWVQRKMFIANDTRPFSRFGIAVSIFEGTALVGADQGNGAVQNSGCAYLFSPDFAQDKKSKPNLFWSTNPEEDILVLLTILPFAVFLIPIFVLSCVYGFASKWKDIENVAFGIAKLCKTHDPDAYDFESGAQSTRGLIVSDSTHSTMDSSSQVDILTMRLILLTYI